MDPIAFAYFFPVVPPWMPLCMMWWQHTMRLVRMEA